jgi:ppGpp synthetase/RelA/SpoT-type nucleotidyltranferase
MATMPLSGRQVVALGERLRDATTTGEGDAELLAEVLIEYNTALDAVANGLRTIGQTPTTRLKTSGTIVEKLRRERHLTLRNIRDLAGARIVRPMTLDEQDALAAQIMGIWPGAKLIDRRVQPSHGYRAVHIVPRIGRCDVEIQVRTLYQDTWAQAMESFGDSYGRSIRYGGEPDEPNRPVSEGQMTRSELVSYWKAAADPLYELAQMENEVAQLRAESRPGPGDDEIGRLEGEIETRFQQLRQLVADVRGILDRQESE